MEFTLTKSSDWEFEETIIINNLEDLKELQNKYTIKDSYNSWDKPKLIIDFNKNTIEVYDWYRE